MPAGPVGRWWGDSGSPSPRAPHGAWAAACRFLPGMGGHGCGDGRAAPSPARAARCLRSRQREAAALVTCVGRFLRQHRTGGTGCQHRGLSRAPPGTAGPRAAPPGGLEPAVGATTGPSVPPLGLAPAGSLALARPWWAGFGLGAGGRRLVLWSCPRRADIPAEPHAMAAPPCWEPPHGSSSMLGISPGGNLGEAPPSLCQGWPSEPGMPRRASPALAQPQPLLSLPSPCCPPQGGPSSPIPWAPTVRLSAAAFAPPALGQRLKPQLSQLQGGHRA